MCAASSTSPSPPPPPLRRGVPSTRLAPLLPYCADQHVVKDGWLGRVALVVECLTLKFADGVVADVRPSPDGPLLDECDVLHPASPADVTFADDHRCPWFPGQKLTLRSVAALHSALRVRVHGTGGRVASLRATVVRVDVDELEVDWVAAVVPGAGRAPPAVVRPARRRRCRPPLLRPRLLAPGHAWPVAGRW